MGFSNAQRAEVLTQALPYIRQYNGKTVVIKYGGSAIINEELKQQVMEDMALLWLVGVKIVLIHGGAVEIGEQMKKSGRKVVFFDGLRFSDTDDAAMTEELVAGKVNRTLVNLLQSKGAQAVGISGLDGRMIRCSSSKDITAIDPRPIEALLEKGYIPVISARGTDPNGDECAMDADIAAACISGALHAERLILMTDINGILLDKDAPASLIHELSVAQCRELSQEGKFSPEMLPTVNCCLKALEEGVENAVVMDGQVPHAILMELLTDEGAGTLFKK